MVFKKTKDELIAFSYELKLLENLSNSRTAESRKVERARILFKILQEGKTG